MVRMENGAFEQLKKSRAYAKKGGTAEITVPLSA